MAAELGLLSLSQLQQLAQQQQPMPDTWSWAGRRETAEEADSWEVRAFARDTASATGTTWPPRSYTCSFCRREFRSAQALGGHMNVHRRDRARLRQSAQGGDPASSPAAASAPPIAFQSADFSPSSGLCLFYPILGSCPVLTPPAVEATSTLLSMAPFPGDRAALDLLPGKAGSMRGTGVSNHDGSDGMVVDEIDLELRLGW